MLFLQSGKEPLKFIGQLSELNPKMYHLADGTLSNEKDEHLHFGQGEYDLAGIIKIINSDRPVTLETPRKTLADDLANLEKLNSLL